MVYPDSEINPIPGNVKWTEAEKARLNGSYDPQLEALDMANEKRALDRQEGGAHYKDMPIQVVEFCQKNKLNYCEANVIKYVCRHGSKNGLEDLKKAKHYIDLLIEMEYDGD